MNFFYSIILFTTFCLSAFGLSTQTTGEWNHFYVIASLLSGIITIVFLGCAVFYNISSSEKGKTLFNQIRSLKDRINVQLDDLKRYKAELESSLTKLYPEYEKELFKGMNPSDSEHLAAIMVKYPELKFNGILTEYSNGINTRLKTVNNLEEHLCHAYREIEDIIVDGWCITTLKVPTDVKKA